MRSDDSEDRAAAHGRIEGLRSLADDLVSLLEGNGPTDAMFSMAPRLDRYRIIPQSVRCMTGIVEGHPDLRDGPIVTSQIFAIDPNRQWMRTMSRFYRLGDPASEMKPSIYRRR